MKQGVIMPGLLYIHTETIWWGQIVESFHSPDDHGHSLDQEEPISEDSARPNKTLVLKCR
jgi:hypothetical protein